MNRDDGRDREIQALRERLSRLSEVSGQSFTSPFLLVPLIR